MQLEQPDTQDSGTEAGQPGNDTADELHTEPVDANDDADPDLDDSEPEEEEEIEVDGRKFALPKSAAEKLKAERLMQADYTRKTQATAERERALDARDAEIAARAEQNQQYIKEVAKVHALDEQLAEYKAITPAQWQQLIAEDPQQAMLLQQTQRTLEAARAEAAEAVTQKQQQHVLAEQQATAKQVQEAEAYVQREIPGWTPELGAKLNSFAQAQGVKLDPQLSRVLIQNPALIKIMHKAQMFDQLKEKQSTKAKTPAPPPAPVTRVSAARASAAKDPDKMSTDDWAKQFYAERSKRR